MTEAADLMSAEAQALRQEVSAHVTILNAVIALELATLGSGLAVAGKSAYVLAGLAAISSFLWLLWIDRSLSILKIAAYIGVELAPRLSGLAKQPVLGWENFLRRIEAAGEESGRALYPDLAAGERRLVRSGLRTDWYGPLLFGAVPPLLLTAYVITSRNGPAFICLACIAGGLLWIYSISRFTDFLRNAKVIDDAITTAWTTAEADTCALTAGQPQSPSVIGMPGRRTPYRRV